MPLFGRKISSDENFLGKFRRELSLFLIEPAQLNVAKTNFDLFLTFWSHTIKNKTVLLKNILSFKIVT